MTAKIQPVVLCGGSGTRLWPLSRKDYPKQFVPLIDGKSLLQLTLERLKNLSKNILCIASENHRFLVQESADKAGVAVNQILEPVGRNTAAAMALAALENNPEALLLFCPADHHIPDQDAFTQLIESGAVAAERGYFVTFGVHPTYPATGYGYIQRGVALPDQQEKQTAFLVNSFQEKPNQARAEQLLLDGNFFWNAGIFLVQSRVLIEALEKFAPDILDSCRQSLASKHIDGSFIKLDKELFEQCRSESIDYAVLERHDQVAVIPFIGQWSDVGGWNAIAELSPATEKGNRSIGQNLLLETQGTYVYSPDRLVVGLGIENLIIVDTPDAVLVAHRDYTESIKGVVAQLDQMKLSQASQHRKVARPWGWYDSVDMGERFQVKRIAVKPGASLSLQMHHHRAEHWIVVKGTAKVTNGEEVFLLQENESTYIPIGIKHRLENPGKTDLEMIEVQSGGYLGEDDIVRFEDTYGRQ